MWKNLLGGSTLRLFLLLSLFSETIEHAHANPDLRFDVVTFCCTCGSTILCQDQFDHLNFPTLNGHYIAMGSDANRTNLLANGNLLAIYYNNFNSDYSTNVTATQESTAINQYVLGGFTTTGPRPDWIVLNEISGSLWPSSQTYRTWVTNVVHQLRTTYNYKIILYAPFSNPGNNSSDWESVTGDAYIGVENYLSGEEIAAENFSVSWCQSAYQSSISSYNGVGVPQSKLILGEHFGQTVSGTGYGRSGASSNDWVRAINARSQAAANCAFAGFIGFDWGGDPLGVSEDEMIADEDVYAGNALPSVEVLTPPFPALQPQSQIVPEGSTVTFAVIPAGIAPVTFQWRFNGSAISGQTNSTLTLTNISPTAAGSYSVLLHNAAGSTASSNALLTVQVPPPLAADPFANATANGGTTYSPGANLIGQTNSQGLTWFQAGPNSALTNQPVIQSGTLDIPGLAYPSGNSVKFGGGGGMCARFQLSTNPSTLTSGTIYYSFILKLTDITKLSSSGIFWAGFNNSSSSQTTTPSVVGTRIYTRASGTGFNLGMSKNSGTASDWQWDNTVRHVNDVIFLVGGYTFSNLTTGDVSTLWINPPASAFGAPNVPVPTLIATSGPNINSSIIASFLIMNRDPTEPASGILDELRIGTSWASVTPPAAAPPLLSIIQNGNNIVLSWPTNATGFYLITSTDLTTSVPWATVGLPVYTVGGQFMVTNSLPPGPAYFRLQQP